MRDGVLALDKPAGPTSHDMVDATRRALGLRRVGHTGTLDPFASGLLLLCLGPTTRIAEYLSGLDKSYEAVARIGVATDTEDLKGRVTAEADERAWATLDREAIEAALAGFRGPIRQIPPQFSAKKVGGVAMHRRARKGQSVDLEPRAVTVHELEITTWNPPCLGFRIRCSSGTYVRSIARDMGEALGVGAHLRALRRTAIGEVRVEEALTVDDLAEPERVRAARIDPLSALGHLPQVSVDQDRAGRLAHGQTVDWDGRDTEGTVVVSSGGALVAIAEGGAGLLRPRKVFPRG